MPWGGVVLIVWVKSTQKYSRAPPLGRGGWSLPQFLAPGKVCGGHSVHPSLPCFVRFQKKPKSKDSFHFLFPHCIGDTPNMGRTSALTQSAHDSGNFDGNIGSKGSRIVLWIGEITPAPKSPLLSILSLRRQGREPAPSPKTRLPEPGWGPGQSTVSWKSNSLPPPWTAHNGCFLPHDLSFL